MVRRQIYLTEEVDQALGAMARRTGKKQSDLIRQALDHLVKESSKKHREAVWAKAAGLWKDRTDLPDFEQLRRELDRDRS